MILSNNLEGMGVKEMGRKSAQPSGLGTLGIGVIIACFHCVGTDALLTDKLKRKVSGRAKKHANDFRNQKGIPSPPAAVDLSLSSSEKTQSSSIL